jgi:hypothetical protein
MKAFVEKNAAFLAVLLLGVFSAVAFLFSYKQNIWVDESTQLSGLSLAFGDIYPWLGGLLENPFSVPSDRMPVLSYWVGFLWQAVFGVEILAMRWLSLVLVLSALLILSWYFLRRQQPIVLLSALVFLCLSPNLTVNAVEIRAYGLFFLFSLIAIVIYVDILNAVENHEGIDKKIIALLVVLMMAVNTHFFGLVLAGAILGTYLLTSFFDARIVLKAKYFLWAVMLLGVAVAFIALPVLASFTSQAGSKASGSLIAPAVKLIYRLVAHQSMMGVSWFPYASLLLVYGVILVSLVKRLTLVKVSLLLILILGASAVFLANVFLSSFDALAPHYNIWMLAVLAVLFGFCVADLSFPQAGIAVLMLSVFLGFGQYTLATVGEKYAHTRFDQIRSRVERYQTQGQVGLLYNKAMAKTWFAGRYTFASEVNQYIASLEGFTDLGNEQRVLQEIIEADNDILIVVYGEDVYSKDIALKSAQAALSSDSPVHQQLALPVSRWQTIDSGEYVAQESADIIVYKKTP